MPAAQPRHYLGTFYLQDFCSVSSLYLVCPPWLLMPPLSLCQLWPSLSHDRAPTSFRKPALISPPLIIPVPGTYQHLA